LLPRRYFVFFFFTALFLGASVSDSEQSVRIAPADILIVHAKVYTVDEKKPWAQSLAIRKGKIVAVGSDEQVVRFRGIGTEIIDAGGKLVLPAFTDSHIHMADGGLSLIQVNLEGAKDVVDIQNRLRSYATQHPDDQWILGRGWNYAMFAPETLPNKKALDPLFPAIPVFLECYDGHTSWANSKALALKESAGDLVANVVPRPSHIEYLNAFRAAMKWANQNGIGRVHSAGGDFEHLDVLQELRDEKQLYVRFHIAYKLEPPELRPQDLDAIEAARKKFHDDWIDANSVKFFLDGVIESHTAALLEPYTDTPTTKGSLLGDPEKYKTAVLELDKRGFQLYSHAVGDYAVRKPLGGFVPSQKLTVAQAVEGYTIEAAYAGHREKTEGSLEARKVADVILVDRNIFEIDPHTINQTKVVITIVGGKIVYVADHK
jgi:predicted amidohydrolase YtcJ